MNYNLSPLKQKGDQVIEWLKKEHMLLRTGTASPTILDGVRVEVYGSRMTVNQIATISTEGPKTLRITPWDSAQSKEIGKAIESANLGLSVNLDDKGIRVHFPNLTQERRETLIKACRQKLEEARITLKTEREKIWTEIQKKVRDSELAEDDKFRLKEDLQKMIDDINKKLEEMAERKEKEILS